MSDAPEFPFLDALDDAFLEFDEDGAVVVWNRAAENVTGYTDAELTAARASSSSKLTHSEGRAWRI